MTCRYLFGGILAGLVLGTVLHAQGVTASIIAQQSFTTGMLGFTTNQTARLNVLNLNPVVTTTPITTSSNCTVELAFYDNKNTLVSSTTVTNFAPGASTSFDLPRASVTSETSTRAEIRGVVSVNPGSSGVASPVATGTGYCSVFTTMEIFDANGSTVALTSDVRATRLPVATPVNMPGAN